MLSLPFFCVAWIKPVELWRWLINNETIRSQPKRFNKPFPTMKISKSPNHWVHAKCKFKCNLLIYLTLTEVCPWQLCRPRHLLLTLHMLRDGAHISISGSRPNKDIPCILLVCCHDTKGYPWKQNYVSAARASLWIWRFRLTDHVFFLFFFKVPARACLVCEIKSDTAFSVPKRENNSRNSSLLPGS